MSRGQLQVQYTLFQNLLNRQIREQYLSSLGGLLWVLLLPMMLLAVYSFVFVEILKVKELPGFDATGFIPYLAVAFWPWFMFSDSLSKGCQSITSNRELIGKIALPRHILVFSDVSASFVLHLAGYLVILLLLQISGTTIHWVMLPVVLCLLLILFVFTAALALFVSATQVFIRDLAHMLTALLMLLFFTTPILYTLEQIPDQYRQWFELNPLHHVMTAIRECLLTGQWPQLSTMLIMTATAVLLLVAGWWYFNRLSTRFEDFL